MLEDVSAMPNQTPGQTTVLALQDNKQDLVTKFQVQRGPPIPFKCQEYQYLHSPSDVDVSFLKVILLIIPKNGEVFSE